MIYGANNFSRVRSNEAKMGAYYTDVAHCMDIGKMFVWPEDSEVCCLEPSIGNGEAIIAVTGAKSNEKVKIFGVELNDEVAGQTKKNPYIEDLVCCDFTDELMCRKNVFSFAFGNPPYIASESEEGEEKVRLERIFLDRICDYLRRGAILVWVVPEKAFCDTSYLRHWMKDYDTLALYKFRKDEYAKWHQIVAVGRKVRRRAVKQDDLDEYSRKWHFVDIPELPFEPTEKIQVLASDSKAIDLFTTRTFRESDTLSFLQDEGISDELRKAVNRRLTVTSQCGMELSRPPIPLKKDSKYLLITSGFSDGLVGNADEGNLHMLRGVSEVAETARQEPWEEEKEEENKTMKVTVTSSTVSELRVLEADGKITLLS